MKRKNFIRSALMVMPALSFGGKSKYKRQEAISGGQLKKGFVVRAGESRYNGRQAAPKDAFLHCKISSADTDGHFLIQTSTPRLFKMKGGPPPHVHAYEDEIIYVVSGSFMVQIDGEDQLLKAGDTAFIPRGTMHTVTNPMDDNPGCLITIFQPAPKKVEAFFSYISEHGSIPENIIPDGW